MANKIIIVAEENQRKCDNVGLSEGNMWIYIILGVVLLVLLVIGVAMVLLYKEIDSDNQNFLLLKNLKKLKEHEKK